MKIFIAATARTLPDSTIELLQERAMPQRGDFQQKRPRTVKAIGIQRSWG